MLGKKLDNVIVKRVKVTFLLICFGQRKRMNYNHTQQRPVCHAFLKSKRLKCRFSKHCSSGSYPKFEQFGNHHNNISNFSPTFILFQMLEKFILSVLAFQDCKWLKGLLYSCLHLYRSPLHILQLQSLCCLSSFRNQTISQSLMLCVRLLFVTIFLSCASV